MDTWLHGLDRVQTLYWALAGLAALGALFTAWRARRLARRAVWRIGAGVVALWLAGMAPTWIGNVVTRVALPTIPALGGGATTVQPVNAHTALGLLPTIPVKGRAPMTGYTSDATFWGMWGAQPNGCDTRNAILARDMTGVVFRAGGCVVETGALADPYTGAPIAFRYGGGPGQSEAVQIDHVVARGDAWATGASAWAAGQRAAFANDPLELLAVGQAANQSKSDGDAATWLPPDKGYRCDYVARQTQVKAKYGLWMTRAEHDIIQNILENC